MKLVLRDYQQEMHDAVVDAITNWDYKSVLVTGATGTGKTVCFASLINTFTREWNWRGLVLAPRRELIGQSYMKVRDMCDLQEREDGRGRCEIDKEMGILHFDPCALVVIGSIQTCYKPTRLLGWTPDYIIVDEAHLAMSNSWKLLFERFPDAVKVGFTATAMRGDRQPVFHENIDGTLTKMELKSGKSRDTMPEECGFIRHVYDYPLEDAINEGWLVGPRVFVVESGVDISKVKSVKGTSGDSDFSQTELNAALSADQKVVADRINKTIGRWKEVSSDRPTLVFCPSVEYSHWAADLWKQAGYTAAAIDCDTDDVTRDRHIQEVRSGNIQVTCNYGIYAMGTDVPEWSSVVLLRPTESEGLLCQWLGRVTRPAEAIARTLGTLQSAQDRKSLIAASIKPDSLVIDVVDIVGKHKLATVPTLLGLPAKLDMQGHKLTEAAALVREFEEVKDRAMFKCPATYEELEASLREIRILEHSGARTRDKWMVAKDGSFHCGKAPPGLKAELTPVNQGDGIERWKLQCADTRSGEVLYDKTAPRTHGDLKDYFDSAYEAAQKVFQKHKESRPKPSLGTLEWLRGWKNGSGRWALKDLVRAGFAVEAIDAMTKRQVFAILEPLRAKRQAERGDAAA